MQLRTRDNAPAAEIVWGSAIRTLVGELGPVALFPADHLVAYAVSPRGRRTRCFLFRTLFVDDALAAAIPGVHPRVRLLGRFKTSARVVAVRRMLKQLEVRFGDPSRLSDDFFLRVAVVLAGRVPKARSLPSLLSSTLNNGDFPWTF